MENQVFKELQEIKEILAKMLGTKDLPADQRFSIEAIDKVAKEFQKMAIERGQWLESSDVSKVIKSAPWNCGQLLVEKLEFKDYFKRGHTLYFNKKSLIELGKELKERNINLSDYKELLDDQDKFEKLVKSVELSKGPKKHFKIPENLRDIHIKPYTVAKEPILKEIDGLMEEYKKFDLSEYIHLYDNKTNAYFKYDYSLERYLKPELKKYCKDWSFKFNYANKALKRIDEINAEKEKSPGESEKIKTD